LRAQIQFRFHQLVANAQKEAIAPLVPVQMLRTDLSLTAPDTLRFLLAVLIEARMRMLRNTLKETEVEFSN
jgi:hypothetical protein